MLLNYFTLCRVEKNTAIGEGCGGIPQNPPITNRKGDKMGKHESAERAEGTVKWFNHNKGFGFITSNNGKEDIFAHYTEIKGEGF